MDVAPTDISGTLSLFCKYKHNISKSDQSPFNILRNSSRSIKIPLEASPKEKPKACLKLQIASGGNLHGTISHWTEINFLKLNVFLLLEALMLVLLKPSKV